MGKELNEAALQKAATFDAMDMVISPNGGHLVVVAVQDGVHVCQQCGEPFDEHDRRWRMVEKKNDIDATVPVGVHAKCFNPRQQYSVGVELRKMAAGIAEKTKLAKVLNVADRLAGIAAEGAKKIVT
jgi:hypothetical protein